MTAAKRPIGPESFAGLSLRLDEQTAAARGKVLFENLLAGQQEVMELVLGGARLEEVVDRLARVLGRCFAGARGSITLFDASDGHLSTHAAPHLAPDLGPERDSANHAAGPVEAAVARG